MNQQSLEGAAVVSRSEVRWAVALGAIGLVVSWAFFGRWISNHGPDAGLFWSQALWTGSAAGLVWDLSATGGIVTAVAIHRRAKLGTRGVLAVLFGTWVLGVCVGLAALWFFQRPRSLSRAERYRSSRSAGIGAISGQSHVAWQALASISVPALRM